MNEDRIINPNLEDEKEENLENTIRPQTLAEYIGQDKVKENMKIYIEAAKKRGEALDHVTNGVIKRNAKARVIRDGIIVNDSVIATIAREKDQVKGSTFIVKFQRS